MIGNLAARVIVLLERVARPLAQRSEPPPREKTFPPVPDGIRGVKVDPCID
jgi:hypothetical protein